SLGFRFISVAVLIVWTCVYWFGSHRYYAILVTCAWLSFVASLFIPVDIDIAGYHGMRIGTSSGGVHFVRLVMGMPMTTRLKAKYGEFIAGGCVVGGLEPKWILVWN